jgi:hypothetical protein
MQTLSRSRGAALGAVCRGAEGLADPLHATRGRPGIAVPCDEASMRDNAGYLGQRGTRSFVWVMTCWWRLEDPRSRMGSTGARRAPGLATTTDTP